MNHTDEPPSISVVLQVADDLATPAPLTDTQLQHWAATVARVTGQDLAFTARLVSAVESQTLNGTYRGRDKPTNVLSFPFEAPPGMPLDEPLYTGDLALCVEVIAEEARVQGKALTDHWTHMIVHGALHLLGYDHIDPADAAIMETLEIHLLNELGIADPYQTPGDDQS